MKTNRFKIFLLLLLSAQVSEAASYIHHYTPVYKCTLIPGSLKSEDFYATAGFTLLWREATQPDNDSLIITSNHRVNSKGQEHRAKPYGVNDVDQAITGTYQPDQAEMAEGKGGLRSGTFVSESFDEKRFGLVGSLNPEYTWHREIEFLRNEQSKNGNLYLNGIATSYVVSQKNKTAKIERDFEAQYECVLARQK